MANYLNNVVDEFSLTTKHSYFVDKSNFINFINDLVNEGFNCICITRARRFGKTLTANMLDTYFGRAYDSKQLFSNLKICTDKNNNQDLFNQNLNKYDVLFLNAAIMLDTIKTNKSKDLVEYITSKVIEDLKSIYPNYIGNRYNDLVSALKSIYDNTHIKFVIIIDEWDALFRNDPENKEAQENYLSFLETIFKSQESKSYLHLGYLTGILPIKQYSNTHSKLNNFMEYTMVDPGKSAPYVGFTENEVKALCTKYKQQFKLFKIWYDGYTFEDEKNIYNPSSVSKALTNNKVKSYWGKSGNYDSIQNAIDRDLDGIQQAITDLLSDIKIKIDPGLFQNDLINIHSKDEALALLVHLGYLTYEPIYDLDGATWNGYVSIPNLEVRKEFEHSLLKMHQYDAVNKAIRAADKLMQATWDKEEDTVASMIEDIHDDKTSLFNYNEENAMTAILMLSYYTAGNYYIVKHEIPAGKTRADVVFKPKKDSDKEPIIVELKFNDCTTSAITQIKERKYVKALDDYKGKVLLVGINYSNDSTKSDYKKHTCKIEEIEV